MPDTSSKSATNRKAGKHQVEEQRASILDAAEKLFLQNGIENTAMVDIAREAGITKVTLYRYFPNRDAIAVAIQDRMLKRISRRVMPEESTPTLENERLRVQLMIRSFPALRDAFRYIGMFDRIYLDNPSDAALMQWTKEQLTSFRRARGLGGEQPQENPYANQLTVIKNTVVWFLEKLALRGELTWSDTTVPLEEHLRIFEDLMMGYFDRLHDSNEK